MAAAIQSFRLPHRLLHRLPHRLPHRPPHRLPYRLPHPRPHRLPHRLPPRPSLRQALFYRRKCPRLRRAWRRPRIWRLRPGPTPRHQREKRLGGISSSSNCARQRTLRFRRRRSRSCRPRFRGSLARGMRERVKSRPPPQRTFRLPHRRRRPLRLSPRQARRLQRVKRAAPARRPWSRTGARRHLRESRRRRPALRHRPPPSLPPRRAATGKRRRRFPRCSRDAGRNRPRRPSRRRIPPPRPGSPAPPNSRAAASSRRRSSPPAPPPF